MDVLALLVSSFAAAGAAGTSDVETTLLSYARRCSVGVSIEDGPDGRIDAGVEALPLDVPCGPEGLASLAEALDAGRPGLATSSWDGGLVLRSPDSPMGVRVEPVEPDVPSRVACWQALATAIEGETGWRLVPGPTPVRDAELDGCFRGPATARDHLRAIYATPGAAVSWVARTDPMARRVMAQVYVFGGDHPAVSPDPEMDRLFREHLDASDAEARAWEARMRAELGR